ncbi:hypothetical protein DFQ03_0523 [Maribacter caenipelagi]|uniref:Uncharacterized protein n=1 Tax=Maribacter caenipelagi TaxID=1447781 RepID=A0A4R7DBQ1_9FLAO|nr:hypothetical protein [Maribacter caenipelagi]TDS18813.1 hypothetical protein DFQ03_0523 [Maribacter caenipelagi]|tara:strand:- start:349 stop:906 length:558 start_codon:yes stop_codon:yes gene_type:complete
MLKLIQFSGKFLKIFFFGIIPFILLSGGSKGDVDYLRIEKGTCSFNVEGNINFHLDGLATFTNVTEQDKFGNTTDKLLLSFTSGTDGEIQTLEFIIAAKSKKHHGVTLGVHRIKNLDRLLNRFSGVYGFADLGSVSELPFFIKSGDIIITEIFSNKVDGKLEVQLENANGETLNVEGSFNADIKV